MITPAQVAELRALRESFGMSQADARIAFNYNGIPTDPRRWGNVEYQRALRVIEIWGPGYRLVQERKRGETG